ncbi:MAG TPA: proprotein convertase P-domain-containing protein [Polyangiaceae bacterium LLY-WYZ-15_(1-7)]|nr:proprotein convertase P-domain-containing protein [Polyangiaceae bacterium LLY-WYZ-15_(1-7)]HJL03032.1 proprotein convertase P-domain-containing protein [Polyangiaceae bacterium LLY-WYZ-15_(1-7)]HJL07717.1 proprotein convertase P-domain-containing protein [Polyangiaceae bacterium LLY-WYZ-15_(1-7)]HJL21987.1 proprotein convertase P-domain-containing protein [Polyangiaceae bacterium LLY-WYZ-15_(1-7)]HJL31055.1 proprotein convertase P-domain-containing protein [Polyangiaceae bacterium LLY-WYZ-1
MFDSLRGLRPALFALALGCAAQPGGPSGASSSDGGGFKAEPVLGATCATDADCDAAEQCARPVCVTAPCDFEGVCEPRNHFDSTARVAIPDADPAGIERGFDVVAPGATVEGLSVLVAVEHSYRGDLSVVLTSPSGTEHVLHDRSGGAADDLLVDLPLPAFHGEPASGRWTLRVADHAAQDLGALTRFRLVFTFGEAAPTTDVWASVETSLESPHPYANDMADSWTLGPITSGAERVRLVFERIDVEQGYDFVEIVDTASGEVLQRFTGSHANLTTDVFDTGAVAIRLRSDYSITDWGFRLARAEVYGAGCLEDADCGAGLHCPTTRVCITSPCYQECVPVESGGQVGDACATNADCAEENHCQGGTCAADGSCGVVSDCDLEGNLWVHVMCVGYATCEAGRCGWECGAPIGGEGDPCDTSAQCGEELYCAGDGTCTAYGECSTSADCNREDNLFPHPACVGTGVCSAGLCGWECDVTPICADGETRFDGCNTCTCTDGRWACTERYCPPTAAEGETCGGRERVLCESGLVCDEGESALGLECGDPAREGVCVREPSGICTREYAPVCGCNGQTFSNDCLRLGLVGLAHEGACRVDRAIPDADPAGITETIDAVAVDDRGRAFVRVEIDHSWRGDLVVTLTAPNGERFTLTNRAGGSEDDFLFEDDVVTSGPSRGVWTLRVADHARYDTGVLERFDVAAH